MRALFIATVRSHIGQFHMPLITRLKEMGWEVDAAYHDNSVDKPGLDLSPIDMVYEIPFSRSPLRASNYAAYRQLKRIIDRGNYDVIHCNTPVGGVIGRLAAKKSRKERGTAVFYTAHGFHFYKGAPLRNWLLFYPVEKYLSRYTDLLITINQEDYDLARLRHFKARAIVKIDGVGVDFSKFHVTDTEEKKRLRKECGFPEQAFIILYAADLSHRKNQQMIFRALSRTRKKMENTVLLLPGQPILKAEYERLCEQLEIRHMVRFLGYRRDIDRLLSLSDCVVSSAKQEGLPLNLVEAAATGKYIVATDVRGNADVVRQSGYGCTVELNNCEMLAEKLKELYDNSPIGSSESAARNVMVYEQTRIVEKLSSFYMAVKDMKD